MVEKVLRKYASREGFGYLLARGPKAAAEIIGGEAPNFCVHVKGSGINLHDWRHLWGTLLGQILGSGAGWPAMGADMRAEADAGFPERTPPFAPRGKPAEVRGCGIMKQINDSTGMCMLISRGHPSILALTKDAISAVAGWDFSREELWAVGERVANLERAFNVRHGLTPQDDYTVAERLIEPPPEGPGAGKSIKPYLMGMVNEYYRLMGWDRKTGKPWRSTLERFGLGDVAKDLWG